MTARRVGALRTRLRAWPSLAALLALVAAGCAEAPTIASKPANAVGPTPPSNGRSGRPTSC